VTNGWANGWSGVSGGVAAPGSSVTALTRNANRIDLFCIGSDLKTYSTWWDASGGWGTWFNLAGGIAAPNTSIAAVARTPTRMDAFAVGGDHGIYTIAWDAATNWGSGWTGLNGAAAPNTSISAVSRDSTHIDLFAVGTDQFAYGRSWDANGGWANWFQIPGKHIAGNTSVNAVARHPDQLDVFIVANDQRVNTVWWDSEIYFSMQRQQQFNWCWAATAASVALYYQPGSGWTQCSVANGETSRNDCCGAGASGPCNIYGFLETSLARVGHFDRIVSGVATLNDIENEVTFARPLGIRVAWTGGGAHFLCIRGHYIAGGIDYLSVDDPIYGRSEVTYSALQSAYQGIGTWTHTYYTRY